MFVDAATKAFDHGPIVSELSVYGAGHAGINSTRLTRGAKGVKTASVCRLWAAPAWFRVQFKWSVPVIPGAVLVSSLPGSRSSHTLNNTLFLSDDKLWMTYSTSAAMWTQISGSIVLHMLYPISVRCTVVRGLVALMSCFSLHSRSQWRECVAAFWKMDSHFTNFNPLGLVVFLHFS